MADVFISYSQIDRAAAEKLANYLSSNGLSVWWDTHLVGGEAFRAKIEEQLAAAKVVIVLWSPNSVASRFVVDEADVAAATGKLVSVLLDGFKAKQTPIGFRSYQAVAVDDEQGIERALNRKGLKYLAPQLTASGETDSLPRQAPEIARTSTPVDVQDEATREEEAWKFVLAKRDMKLVEDFLKEFPNSRYVEEAKVRRSLVGQTAVLGALVLFFSMVGGLISFINTGSPINAAASAAISFAVSGIVLWCIVAIFGDPDKKLAAQEKKFTRSSDT